MSTSSVLTGQSRRTTTARTALVLALGVSVTIALNAVIAAVATAAGATAGYGPLTFPAYGLFTVIGFVVGWFGWTLVVRRARRARSLLRVLVPAVLILSFVPDVVLLITGFIPGTTTAAAIALMLMHVVVAATAVVTFARLAPPAS